MPTTAHHTSSTDDLENRSMVLPNADPQIVSALSAQTTALKRYLAQIHELTLNETTEAIEAFFDFTMSNEPHSKVA